MRNRIAIGALLAASAVVAQVPDAGALSRIVEFQTPSRNIACVLASDIDARCDIHVYTWHVGRPKGCIDLNYGDSLYVGIHGRGGVTCHGDTTFDPKAKVLAYGKSVSDGPFTCSSATSGITCKNRRTRHGFFMSKAKIRLF